MSRPERTEGRLVVASQNPGKVREIARILEDFEVLSLDAFAPIDFPEEGGDYLENARRKALTAAAATGLACVGDDSGLGVTGDDLKFEIGTRLIAGVRQVTCHLKCRLFVAGIKYGILDGWPVSELTKRNRRGGVRRGQRRDPVNAGAGTLDALTVGV